MVGSYNYLDETGLPQTVQYVADEKGFQVTGSTIPVHNLEHPVPVQDTPEVVAAREAHLRYTDKAVFYNVVMYKLKQFVSRDLEKILSLHFLVERIPFSESNTLLLLSFSFFVRRQMSKGFQ